MRGAKRACAPTPSSWIRCARCEPPARGRMRCNDNLGRSGAGAALVTWRAPSTWSSPVAGAACRPWCASTHAAGDLGGIGAATCSWTRGRLARSIPLSHNARRRPLGVQRAGHGAGASRRGRELLPAMVEMLNASGVGCAATPSAAALAGCAGLRRVGQSGHRGAFRRIRTWVSRSRWCSLDEALAHIAATARTTRRHPVQRPRHAVRFQDEVDRRRCTSSHTPLPTGRVRPGAEVAITRGVPPGALGPARADLLQWIAEGDYLRARRRRVGAKAQRAAPPLSSMQSAPGPGGRPNL